MKHLFPSRTSRRAALAAGIAGVLTAALIGYGMPSALAATLLTDNFEDGDSAGWTRSGGTWSVVPDGSLVFRQSGTSADARALVGDAAWTDYAVQARVKPIAYGTSTRYVGVVARAQTTSNYYALVLTGSGGVQLIRRSGGSPVVLGSGVAAVVTGAWHTVRLEAAGSSLRGYVNGLLVVTGTDSTFTGGRAGVATAYASASFDDVEVATVSGTPPTDQPPGQTLPPTEPPLDPGAPPVGFASVNALGQNGTTGGAGGPTVTVDTATEFLTAIAQSGPLNIKVSGMIALPGPMHSVTSDKTIVGVGATSGLTGGGLNIGLPVDDSVTSPPADAVHNVIVRNLNINGAPDDAINVQMFSHHVWIDHNSLSNCYDGLVDVKRGSDYVTVSWNHTFQHTKNMLLGHDDSNGAQDIGRLKVTYHHNWYDRTPQRNPRVRFGEPVHVFNNYYVYNTDVGVACQADAGCVIEGNYFEDVEEPFSLSYSGPRGRIVARDNMFVGESGTGETGGTVVEPRTFYPYTVDGPSGVKAAVTAGSGAGHLGL